MTIGVRYKVFPIILITLVLCLSLFLESPLPNLSISAEAESTSEDTEAPRIFHTPIDQVIKNNELVISAYVTDSGSGVKDVAIFYKMSDQLFHRELKMEKNNGSYFAKIPPENVTTDSFYYFIKAIDNATPANVIYFCSSGETDMEPVYFSDIKVNIKTIPRIIGYSPTGRIESLSPEITIEFNTDMDRAVIEKALSISPGIAYKLRWKGRLLCLIPEDTLQTNTIYTLKVSGIARDKNGNKIDDKFQWSFETGNNGNSVKVNYQESDNSDFQLIQIYNNTDPKGANYQTNEIAGIIIIILVFGIIYLFLHKHEQEYQQVNNNVIIRNNTKSKAQGQEQNQRTHHRYERFFFSNPEHRQQNDYGRGKETFKFRCWNCNALIENKNYCPTCGWTNNSKRNVGYWALFN
jgi:hypothetical protein